MFRHFKTETEDHSIGRILSEKKCRCTGLVSEKTEALYAELNKGVKAANSSSSATSEFLQYICSVLVAKNQQNIQLRCFVHEFCFTDIFNGINHGYRASLLKKVLCGCVRFIWLWLLIAIMKRCSKRCAPQLYRTSLSIFIIFQLQSWIILRVRTKFLFRNFHTKRVVMEIAMMKIFDNCTAGRLNNHYFPLNESPSLY